MAIRRWFIAAAALEIPRDVRFFGFEFPRVSLDPGLDLGFIWLPGPQKRCGGFSEAYI